MVDDTDGGSDAGERTQRERAWNRTVQSMETTAAECDDEDWRTISVAAVHTAARGLNDGSPHRFGFVHRLPEDRTDDVERALERGAFAGYDVLRAAESDRAFFVTVLLDRDARTALLVAGSYSQASAGAVASELEVAQSTVSKHLRSVIRKLLSQIYR